ncbi:hypothetical protein GIY23_07940 [Allosaccharopolyspora coralli]|uniref:Uncharacterized protein n=1 Tax=Allosaccharopolyspora coralli TaxID=2665642 RepID=A0A5Q3QD30_9PSEU|nr:hypothetical protein [Allosaccharopolyspora coralli]QGK69459.1 hypothetical protein GIY23_07940 [Allosaccharopolyspora coralli]
MQRIPISLITGAGLIGGFAVTRVFRHQHLSGLVAGSVGLAATESARRRAGNAAAVVVGGSYGLALFVSHPLARKLGAWPSVCTVAAAAAVTAYTVADRTARTAT